MGSQAPEMFISMSALRSFYARSLIHATFTSGAFRPCGLDRQMTQLRGWLPSCAAMRPARGVGIWKHKSGMAMTAMFPWRSSALTIRASTCPPSGLTVLVTLAGMRSAWRCRNCKKLLKIIVAPVGGCRIFSTLTPP
jgi:hypothetical protein